MGFIAAVGKRGGGVTQPEPIPGDPFFYGPSLGRDWVVANAAMRAVTQPAGSIVTVNPGSLTQATLNANPNATFWVTKGTHSITARLSPLTGQKFYFESAASGRTTANSAVLDAGGASFVEYAFGGTADGVEIHGGVFKNYADASASNFHTFIRQSGANGWLVEDAEIGPNGKQGIRFAGDNFVMRRCYSHENGFYGVNTETSPRGAGVRLVNGLVEHCHFFRNSTAVHGTTSDAGQKFVHCNDSTFRYNYVNGNEGAGLWWDFNHQGHEIHDNVIENCWDWGLFYEWSLGGTRIYRNYLRNNGENSQTPVGYFNKVQLLITSGDGSTVPGGIEVFRNIVDGNTFSPGDGLGFLLGLGNHSAPTRWTTKAVNVHDNQLWLRGAGGYGRVGGQDTNTTKSMWTEPSLIWKDNQYRVPAGSFGAGNWKWDTGNGTGATKTYSQWQAFHPTDDIPLVAI